MTELKEGVVTVKDLIRVLRTCNPEDLIGFSYPQNYSGWDGKHICLELSTNIYIDYLEFDGKERAIIVLSAEAKK